MPQDGWRVRWPAASLPSANHERLILPAIEGVYNPRMTAYDLAPNTAIVDGYGSKVDRAVLALRDMIARGELLPGEHLRQDQLALRLGTTRVPVREAFKTLVAEGLLFHRRNEGHFVIKLTSHELAQLCWLRSALEDELARTARWPDAASVARLREINDRIRALGTSAAMSDIVEIDLALHVEMWNLSDQKILIGELLRVWRMMGPYRMLMGYTPEVVEGAIVRGHEALIDALEHRDRRAYRSSLARHLELAYRVVEFLREREEKEAASDGNRSPSVD